MRFLSIYAWLCNRATTTTESDGASCYYILWLALPFFFPRLSPAVLEIENQYWNGSGIVHSTCGRLHDGASACSAGDRAFEEPTVAFLIKARELDVYWPHCPVRVDRTGMFCPTCVVRAKRVLDCDCDGSAFAELAKYLRGGIAFTAERLAERRGKDAAYGEDVREKDGPQAAE